MRGRDGEEGGRRKSEGGEMEGGGGRGSEGEGGIAIELRASLEAIDTFAL